MRILLEPKSQFFIIASTLQMQDEKEENKLWPCDISSTSFKTAKKMKIWEGLPEISRLCIYYKMWSLRNLDWDLELRNQDLKWSLSPNLVSSLWISVCFSVKWMWHNDRWDIKLCSILTLFVASTNAYAHMHVHTCKCINPNGCAQTLTQKYTHRTSRTRMPRILGLFCLWLRAKMRCVPIACLWAWNFCSDVC